MKVEVLLASGISMLALVLPTLAGEADRGQTITVEQASQLLHYSGGNDRFRVEIAPNYSEELGFSMKGAAGGYLTDAIALGLIVEYGTDKREYLGNAGIQFNDALSLVGTVGILEEHYEYVPGEGKDTVQQMEYGASLKGAYEVGVLSGFELNGYLTNADANSKNVETGKLYGIQLMTDVDLTDTTHFKIGGGYEWLAWDDGGNNNSFAFSAEGTQQLGDMLSINANAKLGASEYVYGGGLALDLSRGGLNTNRLALNYSYIDGRDGVEDDQRVELGWTYGFGAGPTQTASVETQDAGAVRPTTDVAMVSPANNLLGDVMKRPAYLPEQVVARRNVENSLFETGIECSGTELVALNYGYPTADVWIYPVVTNGIPITDFAWRLVEVAGAKVSIDLLYGGIATIGSYVGDPYLYIDGPADPDLTGEWAVRAVYTGPDVGDLRRGCFIQLTTED